MMKRRTEIITFERQRIVIRPASALCPVCQSNTELLTTRQAGRLLQVRTASVRRWLAQGRAHGIRTPGGQHRICKHSLFHLKAIPCSANSWERRNEPPLIAERLLMDVVGIY